MLITAQSIDAFHDWPAGRADWTEAVWFGTWIPESATTIYVYHWFRPALGIYGGALKDTRTPDLGAAVIRETVRRAMPAVVAGVTLGVVGALVLTRLMTRLLYDVTPADAGTFIVMTTALVVIACLSAWVPARRASRVDPLTALRAE